MKKSKPILDSCISSIGPDELKVHPVLKQYFGYCYYKSAIRFKAMMDQELAQFGVVSVQLGILRVLENLGAMSQVELGAGMGIDKASMVKWIDSLEKKRFVTRKEGEEDRRVKFIAITKKGLSALKVQATIRQKVETEFLSVLTTEERELMRTVVPKLLR